MRAGQGSTASLTVDGGSLTATGTDTSGAGILFWLGDGVSGSGTSSLAVGDNAVVKASGVDGGIASNSNPVTPSGYGIVFNNGAGTGVISGTPAADGTSTFTVTAANDYGSDSKELTLTITERTAVPVTGVELNPESLELIEGGNAVLTAAVQPANADDPTVTWESSDVRVAAVDASGNVTAVSPGTATITVKTADNGFTDTCSVTVKHGSLTHTPENAATCTANGNEEYWTCGICGKHFKDAEGNTETTLEQTVIPVVDHRYENGRYLACGVIDDSFQPVVTAGAGGTWQKGGNEGLSFTSNAAFADFVKVQADGKDLAASDYEVREGSTVVTLKVSYLEMLLAGKHTIAIVSATGTATAEFTVEAAPASTAPAQPAPSQPTPAASAPAANGVTQSTPTGDDSNIALWIAVMLAAGAGLAAAAIYRQKRSATAIRKAQTAFVGAAEAMGVSSEDDIQALVDEVRYGKG